MAQRNARSHLTNPDGSAVVSRKQDNIQTLLKQRTEAREEIERIMAWVNDRPLSAFGLYSTVVAISDKLLYLKDKVLREDV